VNQLASALVSLGAPASTAMAVVPLGTANDFATGLGIPEVMTAGCERGTLLPVHGCVWQT
jgi:diacylglycerol kinase family enzyme